MSPQLGDVRTGAKQEMENGTTRGPRAARGEIRERLLEVAKVQFATREFSAVTLRDIAREADVDPGLISYYFGGKTGLFREAMSLPRDPTTTVLESLGDNLEGAGARVVRAVLLLWEEASAENSARLLIGSVLASDETMTTFRAWIDEAIITPVARRLSGPHTKRRVAAATSVIFGMLSARYILRLQPITSLNIDDVVKLYGPLVQHLLQPAIR
ncbi:TetR family transcriptional regulator [Actinobaculum sp. 352]|uniref:TetR/AcrR family transcriptional regulator n=1 Tax=Actinobaculum sp. 352 TaxID=2490946 RepID=UPI0013DEA3DB|nr:TetR family transcriptional regulator [Actinobaculum sp. 352]